MPRPSERLINMKLPTVGSQAKPQTKLQTKLQTKPQAKSKTKLQGTIPRITYAKSTQPTGKFQSFSPLKRLVSKLAGFKLPEHSSNHTKSDSAQKSAGMKTTGLKTTGLKITNQKNAAPKEVPTGVVQDTADQSAIHAATTVSNISKTANIGFPFIKNSKGSRMAFNLLLVRPWVLLLGFWLFSMVVGAVAVEGMVSPKKLRAALPEAVVKTTALTNKNALIEVEQDPEANAIGIAEDTPTQNNTRSSEDSSTISGAVAQRAANSSGFPVLPLTAMIGTCAAGCLVISRRRAMARMAAARSRSRVRKIRANADASASRPDQIKPDQIRSQSKSQSKPGQKVAARKILKTKVEQSSGVKPAIAQPADRSASHASVTKPTTTARSKRRQRNKRSASSQTAANSNRVLVSRLGAQQAARNTQVSSISKARQVSSKTKRAPSRLSTRQQGIVSVVPASESHALDWKNGSLAHQMDVRPTRTASM